MKSKSSAAARKPLQPSRKKLLISVAIGGVSFLVVVCIILVVIFNQKNNGSSTNQAQSQTASLSPEPSQEAMVVPDGWQKFTSKKMGISFVIPKTWSVEEYDKLADTNTTSKAIPSYALVIRTPYGKLYSFNIGIGKTTLQKIKTDVETAYKNDQYNKVTITSEKWRGFDALKVRSDFKNTGSGASSVITLLYAQVGDYVLNFQSSDDAPNYTAEGNVTEEEYKTFASSITIDKRVVEKDG